LQEEIGDEAGDEMDEGDDLGDDVDLEDLKLKPVSKSSFLYCPVVDELDDSMPNIFVFSLRGPLSC
jgi:hypothetical protein